MLQRLTNMNDGSCISVQSKTRTKYVRTEGAVQAKFQYIREGVDISESAYPQQFSGISPLLTNRICTLGSF
jgi:hypothetical protein